MLLLNNIARKWIKLNFQCVDQLSELTATLVGPPGPPGRSKPGRPGPPGHQGPPGLIFFSITSLAGYPFHHQQLLTLVFPLLTAVYCHKHSLICLLLAVCTDRMEELTSGLRGPPGPPGISRRGRAGHAGSPGIPGT